MKKTVSILAKMFEAEEEMITSLLDSLASEEIDDDADDSADDNAVITLSIYTTTGLKSDVVGFGCRTNQNDSEIHYYTAENYSEFKAYIVSKNPETNKEEKTNFDIKVKTDEINLADLYKKLCIVKEFSYLKGIQSVDGTLNANFSLKGDFNKMKSN